MRRVTYDIPGGSPGVTLHPENDRERAPTPVECALVRAALCKLMLAQQVDDWLRAARVDDRDFDGWGAHVSFSTPLEWPALAVSTPGGVGRTPTPSAWIELAGVSTTISAVLLRDKDHRVTIDLHPMGETPLGREDAERLLFSPLEEVRIVPG